MVNLQASGDKEGSVSHQACPRSILGGAGADPNQISDNVHTKTSAHPWGKVVPIYVILYNKYIMKTLIHFIVSALAILITSYVLPGVHVSGVLAALVLAVVLGIINAILRPILIFLTLPITILTLGLFVLVINGALIMLATYIVPGFTVDNFWWALLFGIMLAIVSWVLGMFEKEE
jgi:putative membrane protein